MRKNTRPLRVINLFAGCGGMSLGFQKAGFKIVAAFDNWRPAVEVYRKNFPNVEVFEIDINSFSRDVTLLSKFKPDMIIAGPPCQDFSHAGKRNENLGRGSLTIVFAKIVSRVRPRWFVMENVDRTIKTNMYKRALEILKDVGYGLTCKILDASLCGIPQRRKRFFMIGELNGEDDSLIYYLNRNLSFRPMTVKEYFGDELDIEHYYRHPRNYNRRGVFSVHEPSPTVRGVNRPIPPNYPGHPRDSSRISQGVRPLTTLERSYLQTFPKDFILEGSKTDLEQMIGNAVPVELAEYVARCIIQYIRDPKNPATLFSRSKY